MKTKLPKLQTVEYLTSSINRNFQINTIIVFAKNILLLLFLFMTTRIAFTYYNYAYFNEFTNENLFSVLKAAVIFDISTIVYINLAYILLLFTPTPIKIRQSIIFKNATKWLFIVSNSIALLWNIFDTIYFGFTQRRTTVGIFSEFSNERNVLTIAKNSIVDYPFISLLALMMVLVLLEFYQENNFNTSKQENFRYWKKSLITFVFILIISTIGARGGVRYNMKAISTSTAFQYVIHPVNATIILNTPFSLIQSASRHKMPTFNYYDNNQADQIFTTYHSALNSKKIKKNNIVIIILEGFSSAYSGLLNKETIGKNYQGYTPFLDSLMTKSLIFETSIANGTKSIDVLPSVLTSIPRVIDSYFTSDYSNNKVSSIAGDLKEFGYYSAFFHGAENGSLGLWNFAKRSGFDDYYGKNEYANDKNFDGTWAIWDKDFMEFYADKMNTFKEPFITAFFSATSHNPFKIPTQYQEKFKEGSMPIYKCIRYSDFALKSFFEKAQKAPWFNNTLFIICADHTSSNDIAEHQTNIGRKSIPIIFYFPKKIKPEVRNEIVQQIDIKPSVLGFLGYNKPYIAFGRDIFHSNKKCSYGIFENNLVYEYLTDTYLLQFDGKKQIGLYRYKKDPQLKYNLINSQKIISDSLSTKIKAFLQVYQHRLKNNDLVIK